MGDEVRHRIVKITKACRRKLRHDAMEIGVPAEELFRQFRVMARSIHTEFSKPEWQGVVVRE